MRKIVKFWHFLCIERLDQNTFKYINSLWCVLIICLCFCLFSFFNTIPTNKYNIDFAFAPINSNCNKCKLVQSFVVNTIDGQLLKKEPFVSYNIVFSDDSISDNSMLSSTLDLLRTEILNHKPDAYEENFGNISTDTNIKMICYSSVIITNLNINNGERFLNEITHCGAKIKRLFTGNKDKAKKELGGNLIVNKSVSFKEAQENKPLYTFATFDSEYAAITNSISPKTQWYSPLDISQSYYIFKFNTSDFKSFIDVVDSTSSLTINFNTMVEFSPIIPQPDAISSNSIKYTDFEKIKEIYKNGIEFHAKFPEMTNVQSIRLFALTTILVFAINALIAYFILYFKSKNKRL